MPEWTILPREQFHQELNYAFRRSREPKCEGRLGRELEKEMRICTMRLVCNEHQQQHDCRGKCDY